MAIAALIDASVSPSDEQIAALPNICRCGSGTFAWATY